jgi:hypothetical protein
MKTKQLLVLALVVSLLLNLIFSLMFLTSFSCPLENELIVVDAPLENEIDLNKEQLSELALLCQEQGSWLGEHQECEWVEEAWCEDLGGEFEACASACRHMDPEVAQFCTMECVPVCKF